MIHTLVLVLGLSVNYFCAVRLISYAGLPLEILRDNDKFEDPGFGAKTRVFSAFGPRLPKNFGKVCTPGGIPWAHRFETFGSMCGSPRIFWVEQVVVQGCPLRHVSWFPPPVRVHDVLAPLAGQNLCKAVPNS